MISKKLTFNLFIFFSMSLVAQNKYSWHLVAGPSYATIKFYHNGELGINHGSGPSYNLFYHLGGYAAREISERFSARGGILYERKGAKAYASYSEDVFLDYLSAPLTAVYRPIRNSPLLLEMGCSFDITFNYSEYLPYSARFRPEMTVIFGFELELSPKVSMSIKWIDALTPVKYEKQYDGWIDKEKTHQYLLSVHYHFKKKNDAKKKK